MNAVGTIGALAIQALRMYLELMRMSGRTPEEIEAFYRQENDKFMGVNHPDNLPDPNNP
jgi:hypothetical protein